MAWILRIRHKDGYVSEDLYFDKAEMRYDIKLALKDPEVVSVETEDSDE